jgi:hypothetical protein
MKLISSARSTLGSGQYQIETWQDDEGNEYACSTGGVKVLVRTAADIARLEAVKKYARAARVAADAGDWDEYDRLMEKARSL